MAPITQAAGTVNANYATNSGTEMLVITGRTVARTVTRPIIALHGYSASPTAASILAQWRNFSYFHSLLATGRTVIAPYTTNGWGNSTALGHIDNAIAAGVALGLTDPPHLLGLSMGALNAQAWALTNPNDFASFYGIAPVHDLGAMYDQASFTSSINTAWGTASRSAMLTASAAVDPIRNTAGLTALAGRGAYFCARDDEVINFRTLDHMAEVVGMDCTASAPEGESGGGHLFWNLAADWDEFAIIRHFDANE